MLHRSYTGGTVTGVEKHVVEVGPAVQGIGVFSKADKESDYLMSELIGFSITNQIKGIVTDKVIDQIVQSTVEKSGEKIIEKTAAVAGILIDMIEIYSTAEQGKRITQIDDDAEFFEYLGLYYVSALDRGIDGYQRKIYPGANTQSLVNSFNACLDKEHQITCEEVITDLPMAAEKLRTLGDISSVHNEIQDKLKMEGRWVD